MWTDYVVAAAIVAQAIAALSIWRLTRKYVRATDEISAASRRAAEANEALIAEMKADRQHRQVQRSQDAADRLMDALIAAQETWSTGDFPETGREAYSQVWFREYVYDRDVLSEEELRQWVRRFTSLFGTAVFTWDALGAEAPRRTWTPYLVNQACELTIKQLEAHRRGDAVETCRLPADGRRRWALLTSTPPLDLDEWMDQQGERSPRE